MNLGQNAVAPAEFSIHVPNHPELYPQLTQVSPGARHHPNLNPIQNPELIGTSYTHPVAQATTSSSAACSSFKTVVICIVVLAVISSVVAVTVVLVQNSESSTSSNACSTNQFQCINGGIYGSCIPLAWVCDNQNDCTGGTDEASCTTTNACSSSQFHCINGGIYGSCISLAWVCDNQNDCTGGTDEASCTTNIPSSEEYLCPGSTTTISEAKVCDGNEDCPGGADEDRCLTAPKGYNGGDVEVYSTATGSYHKFCGFADGWTTSKSDEVCQYMGYSSSNSTVENSHTGVGIVSDGSFSLNTIVQQDAVSCTNNKIVEITCMAQVCGTLSRTGRIVGGSNADIEDHPWQISLQTSSGSAFCGGTIIGEKWVLTAAHCVDSITSSQYSRYRVVAGITSLNEALLSNMIYGITQIIYHSQYSSSTFSMDIALIKVTPDFVFSSKIQKACLPTPGRVFQNSVDVVATGWGTTSYGGSASTTLQAVTVGFYDTDACRLTSYSASQIENGMICAGLATGGSDACQGDSGGPLVITIDGVGYLVGATSWGLRCALAGYPGVYADVSYLRSWVDRKKSQNGG